MRSVVANVGGQLGLPGQGMQCNWVHCAVICCKTNLECSAVQYAVNFTVQSNAVQQKLGEMCNVQGVMERVQGCSVHTVQWSRSIVQCAL